MRKSDKKLDNQIIKALTKVCHIALDEVEGFVWLTHTVNFQQFPDSLQVTCMFKDEQWLANYIKSPASQGLATLVEKHLADIGIKLNRINKQVVLDSEEPSHQQRLQ